MHVEDQSDVIAFLSRPETYATGPTPGASTSSSPVDVVETHVSVIFLAGERVYKLKRAVVFPYLDFSTPERRRRFCEAEVAFNRRTAPAIYLGVVPVTRTEDGGLALGGDGQPVDWLVEMRRFDEDTLFDHLADRGVLDRFAMEDLADSIARFHRAAEPRLDAGGRDGTRFIIGNNEESFAEIPPGLLDAGAIERLTRASRRALDACGALLDARRREGFVRHCHGDLHLRNICLYQGRATLFDAIEFSEAFANIDVLYDLAFLIMDLDCRGFRGLASIVLNRYLDVTGDSGGLAALPLFLSMRAAVRSHVDAAACAQQSDPEDAGVLRERARGYLEKAETYLDPVKPVLVAMGGLSGSGKSRLAREVAAYLGPAPGARVVRTDCTRKRIAGVPLGARLGPGGYTADMNAKTFEAVYDEARVALAAGHSVIADAVFAASGQRDAIARVAAEAGVPFRGFWLDARPDVMMERVSSRKRNVSDANAAIVRMQLDYDLGAIDWRRIDTSGSKEHTMAQCLEAMGLEPMGSEPMDLKET